MKTFPMILSLQCSDAQNTELAQICSRLGLHLDPVPPTGFDSTIGTLCGIDCEEPFLPLHQPLPEPMLLLAELPEPLFDSFLTESRKMTSGRPSLLACLTETNRHWTPRMLAGHLTEERTAFRKSVRAAKEKKQKGKDGSV